MAETHSEDEKAQEMERKKALLVYKSNQHSASDDDDDDEEEHDHDHDQEEEEEETASVEDDGDDEEDARSVHSEAVSVEEEEELHDEEDNDDEEEEEDMEVDEDEVQVEKDDDESVNAPSDDDLDSTATPRHDTEDDDEEDVAEEDDTEDSATESKASQPLDEGQASSGASKPAASSTGGASSSGSKLNVEEIIAARRRTGARKECEVCHEGRNGRRAMLCATCKTMYHSSCYRKKYSKLITAMGKQWFCPDCEPAKPVSPERGDSATPRKKKGAAYEDSRVSTKLSAKELKNARGLKSSASSKGHRDGSSAPYTSTSLPGDVLVVSGISGANLLDQELKRVTEIAMRSGRKINALIVERTEEMLFVTQSMTAEIEDVLGSAKAKTASSSRSILHHDEASSGTGPLPPLSALTMISSSEGAGGLHNAQGNSREVEARDTVLRSLHEGLFSLKNMLEQLQVMGIQSEVDLIRDIKVPPVKEEPKPTTTGTTTTARKSTSGAAAARTAAALSAAAKREAKPGASRLYSAKQIQKLEEWYQKSSRPEASEIQAMYRIINSPEYADKELQPDGISVKQIRIWFDNRRAKERLDYMRLKMKDISTADMDAEDVKRMKAAYIDEAKEVLEARVSRLKENGKTVPLIDEADTLLLQSSERPLPMSKSTKASPASKTGGGLASFSSKDEKSSTINQKKRIRIDYVASVRKAVKDARDAGKSEDEIKLIKTAAIERARERLHVPYKNARLGPTKPLGKEEVTHVKMTMLKLLEEDAPAEELTDVVELLLSVIIPHDTLVESQLHRQLGLVLKAHKDNKELVKQTNKLLDEFNTIIEKGDDATLYDDETSVSGGLALGDDDKAKSKKKTKKDSTNLLLSVDSESLPGTPGASPDSPGASPDARKARVKFSRDQLMKLERHFHKEDTPSKKNLEKLSKKLNDIAARDAACEGQDRIDYKQIRSWFYKRRSTNQPPQALSQADLREIELAGTASSSSSASETESDSNDEAPVAAPARKSSKSAKEKAAAPKRKVTDEKPAAASKRQKKTDGTPSETKTPARVSKKEAAASASAAGAAAAAAAAGKQHSGRIFNVKQLATIIEEYEKNPRPTVERLEELQRILNQDDHADDNFVNPLGVTKRQIKTWFSNRRAKERLEVIRMKVQTTDSSAKGKGSSKSKKTSAVAKNDSGASGSDDDGDDDDDDMDEDQPIKKPTKAAASAPSSAKKELFTASSDAAASRHMSDDDLSDDNDDDDDDDVDMGSDDDDDDVEKDSEDDKDDDDDKDSDDDDDDDSDDDVDDAED